MWPAGIVSMEGFRLGFSLYNIVLYLYKDPRLSSLFLDVLAVDLVDFIDFANIGCRCLGHFWSFLVFQRVQTIIND